MATVAAGTGAGFAAGAGFGAGTMGSTAGRGAYLEALEALDELAPKADSTFSGISNKSGKIQREILAVP